MINVVQNENVYEISFPYDPGIIDLVKSVPGRTWVPSAKMWTIPSQYLGFFLNQVKGTKYEPIVNIVSEEAINVNETLDSTLKIPDIDISKVPYYVEDGLKPFKHQLDFMKWAIDRQQRGNMNGFILCDEMGLAKTNQVINLAIYNKKQYGFKHCLIICCTNSAKYNWLDEIRKHTHGEFEPYLLGARRSRRTGEIKYDAGSAEKYQDLVSFKKYNLEKESELPYFIVMNIEAIRYKRGKQFALADAIINRINAGDINMIAIDEIHKNASATSDQGKQLLRVKKCTGTNCMWIPMTGTPITKQPTDVFIPLRLCEGHNVSSYYKWCDMFCIKGGFGGYEIIGYKNIPQLKAMLQVNMIRRLKEDVLDLPPKIHYTEYVENSEYQKKLYKQVVEDLLNKRDEVMMSLNPMTKFLKLRQVNGSPELVDKDLKVDDNYLKYNARLRRLLELLDEAHERGEKTIVFSNWVEPLRTLYKFISKKYKTCVFTGTMSAQDREKHKHAFINNPEYTVLLGTIGAAGTSHTFTVARNAIFYDDCWNPSDKSQAEDRIHRAGTTQSVNIFTLVAKDTVDDKVEQILSTKSNISKYIVDGQLDLRKNPELFDFLLEGGKE